MFCLWLFWFQHTARVFRLGHVERKHGYDWMKYHGDGGLIEQNRGAVHGTLGETLLRTIEGFGSVSGGCSARLSKKV